jgi:enamine deaminase RidA (YjgF/YER057c/UK114 family)
MLTIDPNERIETLGLTLPDPFPSFGTYEMAVLDGSTLYTAGHVPFDGTALITGKLGAELTVEQGVEAARHAAMSMLATIQQVLGDLAHVRQFLQVVGTVNATPDFTQHTAVVDGASDVFVAVFGDAGRHARLAVGVGSLPADMAIEIMATIAVEDLNSAG